MIKNIFKCDFYNQININTKKGLNWDNGIGMIKQDREAI